MKCYDIEDSDLEDQKRAIFLVGLELFLEFKRMLKANDITIIISIIIFIHIIMTIIIY